MLTNKSGRARIVRFGFVKVVEAGLKCVVVAPDVNNLSNIYSIL